MSALSVEAGPDYGIEHSDVGTGGRIHAGKNG
jgi:hypothetical protein